MNEFAHMTVAQIIGVASQSESELQSEDMELHTHDRAIQLVHLFITKIRCKVSARNLSSHQTRTSYAPVHTTLHRDITSEAL